MRSVLKTVGLVAAFLFSALAFGQELPVSVAVAEHETLGDYLTDVEGRTLYLFLNDSAGESTCYEQCAENWPPMLVDNEPAAGEGVDQSLLATIARAVNEVQVTYHGWPLYYFVRDETPGDINGQGVGAVWYAISPDGTPIGVDDADEEQEVAEVTLGELTAMGEPIYQQNCAGCHERSGRGDVGPPLAGNQALQNTAHVVRQIVQGGSEMPPFGSVLNDEQVAAVSTYIRNSWGNSFGPVTLADVE